VNFSIREADTNDCALIRDIASKIWAPTYGSILSDEQLDYMFEMMYSVDNILKQMTEEGHRYLLAFADGEPAGYLSIEKKSPNVFIYQKIYALPELQGKGFGRYLFEQGIDYIRKIHPSAFTIELYVNRENPAVGFYRHIGMTQYGSRDHYIGHGFYMNDYIMTMDIIP
jgi:ribosomal protein S18 acetylase RimI-like enzyme